MEDYSPILQKQREAGELSGDILCELDVLGKSSLDAIIEFLPWYLSVDANWCRYSDSYLATRAPETFTVAEVLWKLRNDGLTDVIGAFERSQLLLQAFFRDANESVRIIPLFQFAGNEAVAMAWRQEEVDALFVLGTSTYWLQQGGTTIGVADIRGIPRWAPNEHNLSFLEDALPRVWRHLEPARDQAFS